MKPNKTIAIIPARGGSKRFVDKNRVFFDGIPLIAHSIQYAIKNNTVIDAVYVSTDDAVIASIAREYGAQVINRPENLSGDQSTTVSALKHALQFIHEPFEDVILLQATNPLRPVDLLKKCYKDYCEGAYDSVMTVSRNEQKFGKITDGNFVPFNYTFGQRSQDLEPLYFENGLLYITKAELILKDQILGKNNLPFIVNHPFATVDIDVEEDLKYAEFIREKYINK